MASSIYRTIMDSSSRTSNFAILKLLVASNEWRETYEKKVEEHNNKFFNNYYMDSGFDVLVPNSATFTRQFNSEFIDMGIKTEMFYCDVDQDLVTNCGYAVFPRSSISKTPLMLANHTGHTLEKIKEDCKRDLYLDAKKALEYNIIDHII